MHKQVLLAAVMAAAFFVTTPASAAAFDPTSWKRDFVAEMDWQQVRTLAKLDAQALHEARSSELSVEAMLDAAERVVPEARDEHQIILAAN